MSKGADRLGRILDVMFIEVERERVLENGTRLDYFVPHIATAFEYDGRQHTEFVEFFHRDEEGFMKAKRLDDEKELICAKAGVRLIRIVDGEQEVTRELVQRLIDETPFPEAEFNLAPTAKELRLEEQRQRRSEARKRFKRAEDPEKRAARLQRDREYRAKRRKERKEWLSRR